MGDGSWPERWWVASTLAMIQGFHACIEKDVYDLLSLRGSLNTRATRDGTAPTQVTAQIERYRARLG